jgi:plastocyanin
MKRTMKAAAVVAAAAGLVLPVTGAIANGKPAPKPKPVKVVDDFFAPTSLSIKAGTKLPFKWDKSNTNSHNVTLKTGPGGVKKSDFKSPTGSIGVKFAPTFEKKGTYDFLCTIHPDTMTLTITVK